ncbi:MAG: hypothetical protein K2X57_09310 [Xanthobacteraceae bacterium]|nr:hypothetical protein [Xanthobacteraceae bacterium]
MERIRKPGFEPIGDTSAEANGVFRNDYERFGVAMGGLTALGDGRPGVWAMIEALGAL